MTDTIDSPVLRTKLNVYLLGSKDSGQNILKDHWLDSSACAALSNIANVQLIVESDLNAVKSVEIQTSVFLILYSPNRKETVSYANDCVKTILTIHSRQNPRIYLIQNGEIKDAEGNEDGKKFPAVFAQYSLLRIFTIDAGNHDTLQLVIKEGILRPLFEGIDTEDINQIIKRSCVSGQTEVLKVFVTAGRVHKELEWLKIVLEALNPLWCTDKLVPRLLATAELFQDVMGPERAMEYVKSQMAVFPRGVLIVLGRFTNVFNKNPQSLHLSDSNIQELPPGGIAETRYTHVSLPFNSLKSVPEELFQLQSLLTLNLSNNNISKVPPVIRWNCPKLKELDLSHNKLVNVPLGLFKGVNQGKRISLHAGVSNETHAAPQRMVLRLTGQNLYPCIHSLASVDISHNPSLSRVPEWVCVLPHITILNLRGLPKLTALPQELGYWESLSVIKLESEKMVSPPPKVCFQRTPAIVAFLKCQLKGSTHYRHMRVMLLGGRSTGKTTIRDGLLNSSKQQQSNSATVSYDFRGEVGNGQQLKITYHPIDFSSRAMERQIYQSFVVNRCVYLVTVNAGEGRRGMEGTLPYLRTLHSRLPDAHALIVVTHVDTVANLTMPNVLDWMKEGLAVDHPASLHNPEYARSCGLPVMSRPLLVDAREAKDIETVKGEIHRVSGDMMGYTPQPKSEEMIPRLYFSLQGVVETRLKRNRNTHNICRYEELFDNFKSISGDLNNEEKEFNLACGFLQYSGALHIQSIAGSSDLYFLNPQWLSNAISSSLEYLSKETHKSSLTASKQELETAIHVSGVPAQYSDGFIRLLEDKTLVIPLDTDRTLYLLPHFLPVSLPIGYNRCNHGNPGTFVRVTSCKHIPPGLFQCLQSQVLTSLHRLGTQLMVISNTKDQSEPEDPFVNYSGIDSIKRGKAFTLTRSGYVENTSRRDLEDDGEERVKRIRAMSFSNPVDKIHQDLTHVKLTTLSTARDTFSRPTRFLSDRSCDDSWISDGTFWQALLWQQGIYMEYGDGTLAWIEGGASVVAIATQGEETACVKALAFLTTCLESVLEDRFPYLCTVSLSPCPECLTINDSTSNTLVESLSNVGTFAISELLASYVNSKVKPVCTKCSGEAPFERVAPEITLLDFQPQYRLEEGSVQFTETSETLIGEGRHTMVYSGCYGDNEVAVKVYQDSINNLWKCFNSLRSELNVLTTLSHAHLLSPVGGLLCPMALVFPLAPLGSLQDHIRLCPSGFDDQISHKLLYQIADGLRYLHSLYIIHRDIKPSNILVWSLDPATIVHVKISDCGPSQFGTPNGLSWQLGTEEFMAPELFVNGRKLFYDEKVDIFSYGVMLYTIVSGKPLIPALLYKPDSHTTNLTISLGQAITSSMEEQGPTQASLSSAAATVLRQGRVHPACRHGLVTMCVAKCLQSVLRDCLWKDPTRRPSAEGICSHLLLCTAPSTQERIIVQQNFPIIQAVEVPAIDCILAWGNHGNQVMSITKESWNVKTVSLDLPEPFVHSEIVMCIAGTTLYLASCKGRTLRSFDLTFDPANMVNASKGALPSNPCCLFSSPDEDRIFVGMEGGRLAMFTAGTNGTSPLEATPLVGRTLEHPDRRKTPVRCGLVVEDTVLCGCGRYLIGLDGRNLQQKFVKPLTEQGTMVRGIANAGDDLWVWFADCSEIIICDRVTGNRKDCIDVRKCLQENVSNVSEVLVTSVSMATQTVWVGTNTGHVMGFNRVTLELLVAVQHHSWVESIVAIDNGKMILVFGKWVMEDGNMMEGFSVWRSHIL